jgi:hypothetical protein
LASTSAFSESDVDVFNAALPCISTCAPYSEYLYATRLAFYIGYWTLEVSTAQAKLNNAKALLISLEGLRSDLETELDSKAL